MVVGAVLFKVGELCGTTVLRPQCDMGRLLRFIGADLVYLGLCEVERKRVVSGMSVRCAPQA
jgi:hypothetical protein